MFAWHHNAPFNYNIALWDTVNTETGNPVCVFKFSNRIDADRFIARNNIKL